MIQIIEKYGDVLKVYLGNKFSKDDYFYCDANMLDVILNAENIHFNKDLCSNEPILTRRVYLDNKPFTHYVVGFENIPEGYIVDHISGVVYDNCRENLRAITPLENRRNVYSIGGVQRRLDNNLSPCFEVHKLGRDKETFSRYIYDNEVDALIKRSNLDYDLRTKYNSVTYEFLKDRRFDRDLVDLLRTNVLSKADEELAYVKRYANCTWYYYRFIDELKPYSDLFNLDIHLDSSGFLTNSAGWRYTTLISHSGFRKPKFNIDDYGNYDDFCLF